MRKIEKMIVRMISCFMIISSIITVSVNAETKTIISVSAPNPSSVSIKKGVAASALNLPSSLKVLLSDDTTETPAVTWNSDTYNPSEVGDYVFYASLPAGYYALNEGVTLPSVTVTVTDGNRYQITNNPDTPLESGIELLDTGVDPQKTYWAYCIDPHSVWPTDDTYFGSTNTSENLPQDIADKADQLTRLMFAGYPTGALGLSALLNTNNPLVYGNYTQHAIWTITNPAEYDPVSSGNRYPYIKALYEYATTGTLTGEFAKYLDNIKSAAVTADKSLLDLLNTDGSSADFTLSSNRDTLVEVKSIPANCKLFDGETELAIGNSISVSANKTLTIKKIGTDAVSGDISFSYSSQTGSITGESLLLYNPSNLHADGNNYKPYQRMIGYEPPTAYSTLALQLRTYSKDALKVTKTVAGDAADTSKEFSFTVTLNDTGINGLYGDMTFANGVANFTLKHGESKTAIDLPEGTKYTVSEASYTSDGYQSASTGAAGTIENGQESAVSFINTKNAAVTTPTPTPETEAYHTTKTGFQIPNTSDK